MANYFGPNSAAWTARSGVVLDPENGPMAFNGAPHMNMIMTEAMMMGMDSQKTLPNNFGMKFTRYNESENEISKLPQKVEKFPSQTNGIVSDNVHQGIHSDMFQNTVTPQSSSLPVMNSAGINLMPSMSTGVNLPDVNSVNRMINTQGLPSMNSTGVSMMNVPMMNANIPPSMFMQTVNFDASQNHEEMNRTMETSMDLLEQQQAVEQAKLLHRFKELRQLQIQQQEILMKQQQEQLEALRSEQHNVHSVIAKQRKNQWGGQVSRDLSSQTRTPPQRQKNSSSALAKAMAVTQQSQQSFADTANQSSLPCPVMYVELNEDNDEIKTNPDLFSDTNSHVGSQCTDDGFHKLPDSASEVGEVPQLPNKKPVSRVSQFHSSMKKHLTEDLDQDEGIGTQSIRSSRQTEHQSQRKSGPIDTVDGHDYHEHINQFEEQDLDQEEDYEDQDGDEDDEEEDEDEDISDEDEHPIRSGSLDDRPVTGLGEKKTFEELLEEQLKEEEEKIQSQALQTGTLDSPKRCFLKKGQGIARFGLQAKSKPAKDLKSIKPKVDSNSSHQNKQSKSDTNVTKQSKATKVDGLTKQNKLLKGDNSTKPQKPAGKDEVPGTKKRATWQQRNTLSLKTSPAKDLKLQKSPKDSKVMKNQSLHDLNKLPQNKLLNRENNKPAGKGELQKGRELTQKPYASVNTQQKEVKPVSTLNSRLKNAEREHMNKSPDSIPDDASFVAKINDRVKNDELEREDLDEFELLENCADNMSFCSQSSFVTRIFQKDRIKQEVLKPVPQSPRQSVAMQLQATVKNTTYQPSAVQHPNSQKEVQSEKVPLNKIKEDVVSELKQTKQEEKEEESSEEEEEDEEEEDEDESSEDSSDETETDEDSEDDESEDEPPKSPTKIMTRKVASQNTVSNLLQKLKINSQNDSVSSLNTSSFAPNAKSPIVISKEVTSDSKTNSQTNIQDDSFDDTGFKLHSQISGLRKSGESTSEDGKNDSDDSENSYSNLKIIPKRTGQFSHDPHKLTSDDKLQSESYDKHSCDFDDEDEWGDTTLKEKSPKEKSKDTKEDVNDENGTPPTSKLVAKLFPKLKPQPSKQQIQDQQKLQTVTSTVPNDGIQSKVLHDKLAELEKEIEKFRNENLNLDKLRKEREEGLQRLKKEISNFEKEKNEELNRIQEYKNEEMKKLKHEKKMFEKYQKAARDIPNKKEREEIETMKNQLTDLQEEMKRKETRWTSSNSRLRSKIEQLEQENSELKEEIKLMEKRRLEWLQKDQNKGKTKSAPRSSTPTQLVPTQSSADFQTTDSDEEKDPVRDSSSSKASNSQMSLRSTQSATQVHVPYIPPQTSSSQPNLVGTNKNVSQNLSNHPGNVKRARPGFPSHSSSSKSSQPNIASHPGPSKVSQPNFSNKQGLSKDSQQGFSNNQQKPHDHLFRMSLMEDVPRSGAAVAMPQDTSLYTDTEGDISNSANVPRKTASKYSVDRSMIDKGTNGYDEFQHNDGKIERIYKTGAREILFPNGTRKEISADGKSIVVSFFNGDIKQIMPDQRVIYYYAEAQTTHSNYPDGLEVLQFPNNQVEKHYPDGTKEITFADQTIKYLFPNGSEESIFPDGTVIRVDKNGDKTMEFPNGQREIHTNDYKKREYPDGTVKTVYPDGRQETRYSNGRIRVKDRDGNVIVDRRC